MVLRALLRPFSIQRWAKAHSRQAKFDRLKLFSRLGLKPLAIFCRP